MIIEANEVYWSYCSEQVEKRPIQIRLEDISAVMPHGEDSVVLFAGHRMTIDFKYKELLPIWRGQNGQYP